MMLPFWRTVWQFLKLSNLKSPHDPAVPLLHVNPNTCACMCTAAQFPRTTQMTINKWSENRYTQWGPSTQWNMTQPWKGVKLWHRLQCGWTLNTWYSVREADTEGHTARDSIYRKCPKQANPQRMKVGLWWLGDWWGGWVDRWMFDGWMDGWIMDGWIDG